jgi:uncharacterized damage-inducible protein DinB
MSTREFFIQRWEQEQPAFLKVLRAIPEGQLRYRPHERCTAAGALAWQLVEEQQQIAEMIDTGQATIAPSQHPEAAADIAGQWEKATDTLRAKLKALDDAKWGGAAKLVMGGEAVWSDTLENMCWGYLFDMVHHRGQMTSYLRPMGGKVPAIYGPSADDSGA